MSTQERVDLPSELESSPHASDSIETEFAPASPTDGRKLFDPVSRWEVDARADQLKEGIYLALLGALGLGLLIYALVCHTEPKVSSLLVLLKLGGISGLLGGTMFTLKWWYHSIAKGLWHVDRRPWRIAVPWGSAVLAAFVCVLLRSDLVGILKPQALENPYNILAVGFLAGYFSDNAIAKLSEIAQSLFGARERSTRKDGR